MLLNLEMIQVQKVTWCMKQIQLKDLLSTLCQTELTKFGRMKINVNFGETVTFILFSILFERNSKNILNNEIHYLVTNLKYNSRDCLYLKHLTPKMKSTL